jgi:acyl dehydratase
MTVENLWSLRGRWASRPNAQSNEELEVRERTHVKIGETRTTVVIENLTRTQLVMYAGASGDYSPMHTDEIFAVEVAGYPSVFAHGMLSMGATGRLLTDWFGVDGLERYTARFVNQVWPGDTLTATGVVTSTYDDNGRSFAVVEIETINQHGDQILIGTAVARVQISDEPKSEV